MKRNIPTLPLVAVVCAMVINGCGPYSWIHYVLDRPARTPPVWLAKWLENPTCPPPCWEGITPGVSTFQDAQDIVESLSGVSVWYKMGNAIEWSFDQTEKDDGYVVAWDNGNVAAIVLESSDYWLPLGTVIAAYGEPSYVDVNNFDCRQGTCMSALVFPGQGMVLEVFVRDFGDGNIHRVEIQPNTIAGTIRLRPAGLENFQDLAEDAGHPLVEWTGYGGYTEEIWP